MPDVVMNCPLCGVGLTDTDRGRYDRYTCRACYDTSAEAKRGWVPTAQTVPVGAPLPQTGLTRLMADNTMFASNAMGKPITRERTCECGRRFTQTQLSARFLTMVERHSARAIQLVCAQIPEYFVPVHCPPCERVDLGHAARIADRTIHLFGARDAAD